MTWALGLGAAGLGREANAAQVAVSWDAGAGTTNWSDANNWSTNVVPDNGIPAGTTYAVTINDVNTAVVHLNTTLDIDALTIGAGRNLTIDNGRILTIVTGANAGTITNAGTIALNSTGSTTDIRISGGAVTLSGGGVVAMSNVTANRFTGLAGTDRLTNVDNTISGSGQIGANFMAFTNQGTVTANQTSTLTIDPTDSQPVVNTGTLRAVGGGTLVLNTGAYTNTGGIIEADSTTTASTVSTSNADITGGTVRLVGGQNGKLALNNGSEIRGGTLTNNATGVILNDAGTNTLGGTVSNPAGGQIQVDNGTSLVLEASGTYTNAGSIALNSSGSTTDLRVSGGTVTLGGGGTVQMSDVTANRIVGVAGTDRLTNTDNTISGAGQIGGNFMGFTNQGNVTANMNNPATNLTIDPTDSQPVINTGTMKAVGGGTLVLNTGAYTNTNGIIEADSTTTASTVRTSNADITGGTVRLVGSQNGTLALNSGSEIRGGTLINSATGLILNDSGTNTLSGTVSNPAGGQIQIDNGTFLVLEATGTFANAGSIALNSTGSTTDLRVSGGTVTLSGGGTVTMSNVTANRITGVAGVDRLANSDNTISGAGQIGANFMGFTNQGTVRADQFNTLTVDLSDAAFNNSGTIQVASGSTMPLGNGDKLLQTAGGTIVDGTLSLVGSASLVDIQGGSLSGSGTINGKVTNAGTVGPGSSAGALTINGNYTQTAAGELSIELGGATAGTGYDRLAVTGTVTLDGALDVALINSFVPGPGDVFTFLDQDGADPIVGIFAGLPEAQPVGVGGLCIAYGANGNDAQLQKFCATPTPTITPTRTPTPTITPRPTLTPAATATPGAHFTVNFSQSCELGTGVGIAFDGGYLWYTCIRVGPLDANNPADTSYDLFRANPRTGVVSAKYNIAGGLGALAYDAQRNVLWAGWGGTTAENGKVYKIPLDDFRNVVRSGVLVQFTATASVVRYDIDDGLAYDSKDDTFYISEDVDHSVRQYDINGTLLRTFDFAGDSGPGLCSGGGSSGLAIGGELLYQGGDGCNRVFVVDKLDPAPYDHTDSTNFSFSTTLPNDSNFRDEDLECDTVTFASEGKHVMWSVEAYEPRRAKAFQIPFNTCGTGGNPPLTPPATPRILGQSNPAPGSLIYLVAVVGLLLLARRGMGSAGAKRS